MEVIMDSLYYRVPSVFDDFIMTYLFIKNWVELRIAHEFVDLRY